jgi:2-phospho-L-lactate guanylyltransferase
MPSPAIWAVVPVKPFDDAKSRLSGELDAEQRRELARVLMRHAIGTLLACAPIQRVVAISADDEALASASLLGAETLRETGRGLNPALEQARRHAMENGAASLLVLASDLPLLLPSDIDAMTALDANVVIAHDRRSEGTNALLLRPANAIGFSFGPASYGRHTELAALGGLTYVPIDRPGLAFDIDLPEDWHDLLDTGWRFPASQPSSSGV